MDKIVKVLIVEHDVNDIELLQYELKKNRFEYTAHVVETREKFEQALSHFQPDIILSDYNLPSFDAVLAFQLKQKIQPELPFIIVSGMIGEENAVELIKNGVTDYVIKDKLFTILPKIRRALKECKDQKEKAEAEKQLAEERIRIQKMLVQATIEGQEKERAEIGKELHDNINQILSVIKLYISYVIDESHEHSNLLDESLTLINNSINEIRRISQSLIPPEFNREGLIEAVDALIERIKIASPFSINFMHDEHLKKEINEKEQLALYRIIQEQLNNIIKHAGATEVDVELKENEDQVFLQISDNGKGFDPGVKRKGVGLNNMLSRVKMFDGDLQVVSEKGAGCILKVCLPKVLVAT